MKEYICHKQPIDSAKFSDKLKELGKKNGSSDGDLATVIKLATDQAKLNTDSWNLIKALLEAWPKDDIFPLFDALRFATSKGANPSYELVVDLIQITFPFVDNTYSQTVIQLAMKVVANLFVFQTTKKPLLACREGVLAKLGVLVQDTGTTMSKAVEQGVVNITLNFSTLLRDASEDKDKEMGNVQVVSNLVCFYFDKLKNMEALYRCVVTLCNTISLDNAAKDLAKALDAEEILKGLKKKELEKLDEAVAECLKLLEA